MKETVSLDAFIKAFKKIRPDTFSLNGLECLFEYINVMEEGMGEEFEFDVIALCCDYSEYEDISEYNEAYSEHHGGHEFDDREELERTGAHGTFIAVGRDGFIVDNI